MATYKSIILNFFLPFAQLLESTHEVPYKYLSLIVEQFEQAVESLPLVQLPALPFYLFKLNILFYNKYDNPYKYYLQLELIKI